MRRLLLALAAIACSSSKPEAPTTLLLVRGPDVDLAKLEWSPRDGVRAARRTAFGVELELSAPKLQLTAPDACPVVVDRGKEEIELKPWIRVRGGDLAQLGFAAPFTLSVEPGCREAIAGRVSWKQLEGAKVSLEPSQNGFVAKGTTPPLGAPVPHGIVPLSPRTRGQIVLEATWTGTRTVTRKVTLSAAARASGLPSVAPGQRVLLGGDGWKLREKPKGAKAELDSQAGLSALRPDLIGRYLLADASGATLSIAVGTHADAALDCGRSDCHASAARHAVSSPMTTVFARGMRGELADWDASCVIGCHTAGEPGLADGGFAQVHAELGEPRAQSFPELPRALRRLAGVGCTACHGPGAIPEPSASWAILRSDVCAVCHDAPPRYPHVAQWSKTVMAKADHDERARSEPACQRCHTTAGFLGRKPAPEHASGIGCAACHAPHAAEHGDKLVRKPALPAGFPALPASAGPSRVCIPCHSGPEASAATILFGAKHPHAELAGGCIACHGERKAGRTDHGFAVDRKACKACHREEPVTTKLRARAEGLWKRLGGKLGERPPHAEPKPNADRAALLVRLVIEDAAAGAHNAPYAKKLLDEAEALLERP